MKRTKHVFILENNHAESLSLDHFSAYKLTSEHFTADKMDYFIKTETDTIKTI